MANLVHVNDSNFTDIVEKATKPALVDFGASWCGPCKTLEPKIEQLAVEYGEKIDVIKADVDDAVQVATRFGIMGVPTVIFFKNGKEVYRFMGDQSKDKIASMIQSHLLS